MINRDHIIARGSRIYAGNLVSLENDKLVDYKEHSYPHFKIKKCMGTLQNTRFQIHLENLDTNETKIITL